MSDSNELLNNLYPYISKAFFCNFLQQEFPEKSITIQVYTINSAIPPGENFCSQIIRACGFYTIDDKNSQHNEIRFIIRAALSDAKIRAELDPLKGFEREIAIFKYIVPEV